MLTDTKVQKLKPKEKPYREIDCNGLYLLIEPNGRKKWQFRFTWESGGKKKRPWQSLGPYPEVSLKTARQLAFESRELLVRNINPIDYQKQNKNLQSKKSEAVDDSSSEMTFEELFKVWHKHHADTWSYDYAKDIWERVEKHLLPEIGMKPVVQIKPMDMIHVLKKIESMGLIETTRRLKQYANRVFRYGVGFGYCDRNPVSDLADDIFKKSQSKNYPHVTKPGELAQVLWAIDSYQGDISIIKALQMQPHVFLRSFELAGLRWEEIDLLNRVITIPAKRMKMKREHLVPISSQVLEIVEFMKPISSDCDFLFPSSRSKKRPINEQSLNAGLHRLGLKGTQSFHGFRHTASTLLNELGYVGDIIEKQLAHEDTNKVRRVYNKAEYLEQRTAMMQQWSNYLDKLKLKPPHFNSSM